MTDDQDHDPEHASASGTTIPLMRRSQPFALAADLKPEMGQASLFEISSPESTTDSLDRVVAELLALDDEETFGGHQVAGWAEHLEQQKAQKAEQEPAKQQQKPAQQNPKRAPKAKPAAGSRPDLAAQKRRLPPRSPARKDAPKLRSSQPTLGNEGESAKVVIKQRPTPPGVVVGDDEAPPLPPVADPDQPTGLPASLGARSAALLVFDGASADPDESGLFSSANQPPDEDDLDVLQRDSAAFDEDFLYEMASPANTSSNLPPKDEVEQEVVAGPASATERSERPHTSDSPGGIGRYLLVAGLAVALLFAGKQLLSSDEGAPSPTPTVAALESAAPAKAQTSDPTPAQPIASSSAKQPTADPDVDPAASSSAPNIGGAWPEWHPNSKKNHADGDGPTVESSARPAASMVVDASEAAPTANPDLPKGAFDHGAAQASLASSAGTASGCGAGGDAGAQTLTVRVTFAPSGSAISATVSGAASKSVRACVARVMRSAWVPAFDGAANTATTSVTVR